MRLCSVKCDVAVSCEYHKSSLLLKPQRQHYGNLTVASGSAAKIVARSSGSVSSTPCLEQVR